MDVLDQTRRIAVETLGTYPVKIYLFGSWARGTPSESSDIDLAIDSEAPLPTTGLRFPDAIMALANGKTP